MRDDTVPNRPSNSAPSPRRPVDECEHRIVRRSQGRHRLALYRTTARVRHEAAGGRTRKQRLGPQRTS